MLCEHEPQMSVSTAFLILLNFHECFYNSTETQRTCFLFLQQKTQRRKKGKQLVYFHHQNVNSLSSCNHCVNSSCYQFWILMIHDFEPIFVCLQLYLQIELHKTWPVGYWICNTRAHNSSNHSSEQVTVSGADRWSKGGLVSILVTSVNSYCKGQCYTGTLVGDNGHFHSKTQADNCKEYKEYKKGESVFCAFRLIN